MSYKKDCHYVLSQQQHWSSHPQQTCYLLGELYQPCSSSPVTSLAHQTILSRTKWNGLRSLTTALIHVTIVCVRGDCLKPHKPSVSHWHDHCKLQVLFLKLINITCTVLLKNDTVYMYTCTCMCSFPLLEYCTMYITCKWNNHISHFKSPLPT